MLNVSIGEQKATIVCVTDSRNLCFGSCDPKCSPDASPPFLFKNIF